MSILKQVGLLTAGAQPWNANICTSNGNKFAYCATLAIYIYEYDVSSKQFILHSIMCEHKKTITVISWQMDNSNILASCSCNGVIIVWNIKEQRVIAKLESLKTHITNIEWCENMTNTLSFMQAEGPLLLWKYSDRPVNLTVHNNSENFDCDVCIFKWNLKDKDKVCFGHEDGSISVLSSKSYKHAFSTIKGTLANDHVLCMEWDPLSVDYLLVSTKLSGIRLIDTSKKTIITQFKLPKMESMIQNVCWISTAPGMFISGDATTGTLRLWSVAKDTPLESVPVKETGFRSLFLMDLQRTRVSGREVYKSYFSGSAKKNDSITVPSATIVSVFQDGGVGVYDLKSRKWIFLREKGHIETIFTCEFHPSDPNILATASFDGSIKVWDITIMTAIHISPGNLSIIYALSWGPEDSNCIFAGTLKYDGVLWNMKKDKVIHRYSDHGGKGVHCCSWNRMDRDYIASSGADNYCCIRTGDGTFKRYKHPAEVYGCDWCPMIRDLLATGCADGVVRIFYIPGEAEPLKTFTGHTKKVFAVKWSPLKDGILCSGSDDKTIRVWDYTKDTCMHCLEGHTQPVRGLLWNSELPHIVISGSWDYSVKVWDTRTGYCLDTSHDHAADVYGLASHPQRPFLFASTSRDSTLRLWTMQSIVQPLYISYMLGNDIEFLNDLTNVLGNSNLPFAIGICGVFMKFMAEKKEESIMKKLQCLSHFLLAPVGISNFWILVSIIHHQKKAVIPENYKNMIMHISHLTKYKGSEAQELESSQSNFHELIGPKKKADLLMESARIYMSLGQMEHYCEIMIELNQWEKALSIAPSVSIDYWKSLTKRYAAVLSIEENPDAAVYWMASRDIKALCNMYIECNQYHEAMLAIQVANENNFTDEFVGDLFEETTNDSSLTATFNDNLAQGKPALEISEGKSYIQRLHSEINEALANWYFANGNPVIAACCHLSVENIEGAISKLLRANELELAYSLSKIFPSRTMLNKQAAIMLSLRCERYNLWGAAISIWKENDENDFELFMTCARFPGTEIERSSLHVKAGLPSPSECREKAALLSQQGNFLESLKYYVVSSTPDESISAALNHIITILREEDWNLNDVFPYVKILGCIRTEMLANFSKNVLHQLLAVSAYIGALHAIRLSFNLIVSQLFAHAISILKRDDTDIGIRADHIQDESQSWLVEYLHQKSDGSQFTQTPTSVQRNIYKKLMKKCGNPSNEEVYGEFIVVGHHIPGHCVSHIHAFTKERIKGPAFILEDGKTALPHSYALMWAHVNAFSPLNTGYRLNPF